MGIKTYKGRHLFLKPLWLSILRYQFALFKEKSKKVGLQFYEFPIAIAYSTHFSSCRDSRVSEARARTPRQAFLEWVDFNARSRSAIPEEKWGLLSTIATVVCCVATP